jgi:hypothetical protein
MCFVILNLLSSPWVLRGRKIDVFFVYSPLPMLQELPAIIVGWLQG